MISLTPDRITSRFSSCQPLAPPAARAGLTWRRKGRNEERKKQNRYRWQGYYCPGRLDG